MNTTTTRIKHIAFELFMILVPLVIDVAFVILIALSYQQSTLQGILLSWIGIIFPSSLAIIVPFILEAHRKWGNMPELEIKYEPRRTNKEEYGLYHHVDVPLWGDAPQIELDKHNYILVGVKNVGNSVAKECFAKLWIYKDSACREPFDNPFTLYWSHDPNSKLAWPPSLFNLPPQDIQFLAICHKKRSNGEFQFDDHGQFTTHRQKKLEEVSKKQQVFYIRIIAYGDKCIPKQKCFKLDKRGDYSHLEMTEHNPPQEQTDTVGTI